MQGHLLSLLELAFFEQKDICITDKWPVDSRDYSRLQTYNFKQNLLSFYITHNLN
jgi:hypothetical protein